MNALASKHSQEYKTLARRLREAREAAGMTQVEAAIRLGKPQSFVSKCEAGERRIDAIELKVFADLYSKPVSYFLDDIQ
jgi:transcriptional regulator with XRE-family HTH domain